MLRLARIVGVLLIVIGLVGYVMAEVTSLTALIPAAFGLIYYVLAALGHKEEFRKHAMHILSIIALLGMLGTARGFFDLVTFNTGGADSMPLATISKGLTFILNLVFLVAAVRSFIAARRARLAEDN